jgi:hypothetical protein
MLGKDVETLEKNVFVRGVSYHPIFQKTFFVAESPDGARPSHSGFGHGAITGTIEGSDREGWGSRFSELSGERN